MSDGNAPALDYRLEVVVVPVADVDRAKRFYAEGMGFDLDHDAQVSDDTRVVQLTPRGSDCSIVIGTGRLAQMKPGTVQGLQLVVSDMAAAKSELAGRGVDIGEIRELGRPGRPGFKHAFFSDPDGNGWVIQELPDRG